eukprot:TRINITY_DN15249_c0_g1_i1.p1 TRINITY_DN15249_c0_g1~~TRINITY_DN15249_c0_g1_i1.p1  ORF type:complete len:363 (-),score=48.63 TRINITY_DN15249_c0_g1_i1:46-1134(-)
MAHELPHMMFRGMEDVVDDSTPFCENNIDDNFFNQCRLIHPPNVVTLGVAFFQTWFNPFFVAQVTMVLAIVLPLIIFGKRVQTTFGTLGKYRELKLCILNFMHRITYTLVLDVALYAVFRQLRPCSCLGMNCSSSTTYSQIGSIYGMPSGDAMAGAIIGATLIDDAPLFPIASRVFGVLVILLAAVERVTLGYHSIGQVMTGATIGVVLHFYSTRAPQFMVFVDGGVTVALGFFTLFYDKELVYTDGNPNNIYGWFVNGCGYVAFVMMMLGWHYYSAGRGIMHSYKTLSNLTADDVLETTPLGDDKSFEPVEPRSRINDSISPAVNPVVQNEIYVLGASLFVFSVITFLSLCVTQYNWFKPF